MKSCKILIWFAIIFLLAEVPSSHAQLPGWRLSGLDRALSSGQAAVQAPAIEEIAWLHQEGLCSAEVIQVLFSRMDWKSFFSDLNYAETRLADAFRTIGSPAVPAVPWLLELVSDPDRDEGAKLKALAALEEIRPPSHLAAAPLFNLVINSTESAKVRGRAAEVYTSLTDVADALVSNLIPFFTNRRVDPLLVEYAANALGRIGSASTRAGPFITQRLLNAEGNPAEQMRFIDLISRVGPPFTRARRKMIQIFEKPEADVEVKRLILQKLPSFGDEAVSYLFDVFENPLLSWELRGEAAIAFCSFPYTVRDRIPAVMRVLVAEETAPEFNVLLVKAIGSLGRLAEERVTPLVNLIKGKPDADETLVITTLSVLSRIQTSDWGLLPELRKRLKSPESSPRVRRVCISLIGKLGARAATLAPLLHQVMMDPEEAMPLREAAARASGKLAAAADTTLPKLMGVVLAQDLPESFRLAALEGVISLGPTANNAVPELLALLKQPPSKALKEKLVQALGAVGPAASDAAPELVMLHQTADPEEELAYTTAYALHQVMGEADVELLKGVDVDGAASSWFAFWSLYWSLPEAEPSEDLLKAVRQAPGSRQAADLSERGPLAVESPAGPEVAASDPAAGVPGVLSGPAASDPGKEQTRWNRFQVIIWLAVLVMVIGLAGMLMMLKKQ